MALNVDARYTGSLRRKEIERIWIRVAMVDVLDETGAPENAARCPSGVVVLSALPLTIAGQSS